MPTYRLHATKLTDAAAARGDRTSYAIAKRTGLSQDTIGRLRRGTAEPTVASLVALATAYGLTTDDLLVDQEQMPADELLVDQQVLA